MEKINRVHCLFEQSGTFKNVFRELGYVAFDYDIKNEFGETDVQTDLFQEIEKKCPYFTRKLFDYLESVDTWLNGPQTREKQIRIRKEREIARINQHLQTLDYYDLRKLFQEVKFKKEKKSLWDRFKESLI